MEEKSIKEIKFIEQIICEYNSRHMEMRTLFGIRIEQLGKANSKKEVPLREKITGQNGNAPLPECHRRRKSKVNSRFMFA